MTTISARVILDSTNLFKRRLTTLELVYPRWIHAEGRTHRKLSIGEDETDGVTYGSEISDWEMRTPSLMEDKELSRNASSSRAIPVNSLIQAVLDDPAVPIFWGLNQKGMQAARPFTDAEAAEATAIWLESMHDAIKHARRLADLGAHKQNVNRALEPYSHIRVIVSSTTWANFLHLRDHDDAEPHIRLLAQKIKAALVGSKPKVLAHGEWHLPYVDEQDHSELIRMGIPLDFTEGLLPGFVAPVLAKVSAARCARTSYLTHDRKIPTIETDLALYDRLAVADPLHASPTEHQARCSLSAGQNSPAFTGNFQEGFVQFRKLHVGEQITEEDLKEQGKLDF